MNERNVAALEPILVEAIGDFGWTARGVAERLAARGVLVPSALTFEELTTVYAAAVTEGIGSDAIVAALDRIAKGATR